MAEYTGIKTITINLFEKGSIEAGQDNSYKSYCRIRSGILYNERTIKITANDQQAAFVIYFFSDSSHYASNTGWVSTYLIPKGTFFRILMTNYLDETETRSLEYIYNKFEYEDMPDDKESFVPEYLEDILTKVYGEDVRNAIYNALAGCCMSTLNHQLQLIDASISDYCLQIDGSGLGPNEGDPYELALTSDNYIIIE